jgi:hypothetical protein
MESGKWKVESGKWKVEDVRMKNMVIKLLICDKVLYQQISYSRNLKIVI